ncbi:MAG: L-rhamnose mutarotase [Clostridia bacterium]
MGNISRNGCVIGVKPGMLERYIYLHDHCSDEIRELLRESNCIRCDIFASEIEGKTYLFQYVEKDESQAVDLSKSEVYSEWARVTSECQQPLPGEALWQTLRCVFTLDTAQT